MSTREARQRASKAYYERKIAAKLAGMTPEQRAKYEKRRAILMPCILKAQAARLAKGEKWMAESCRKAALVRHAKPNGISQDKPKQNNMPNAETIQDIPPPSQLLAVVADMPPKNGVHHEKKGNTLWDENERKRICVAIAAKLRAQGLRHAPQKNDREGNRFFLDALRAAQYEVLERERRRHISTRAAMGSKFWRDLEIALTAGANAEALVKKVEAQEAAKVVVATPATVAAPAAPVMSDEQLVQAGLAKASLAELMQAAMARVFETLGQHETKMSELHDYNNMLVEELDVFKRQMGGVQTELINLRGTAKKKLPTVAILGCQLYIYQHIIDGAKSNHIECDFRHYESDSKPRQFTADYALAMHWMPHGWDDQIHNAVPDRTRVKFLATGGVGMAIKQLKEWFSHE